jgi:hypothetical protein
MVFGSQQKSILYKKRGREKTLSIDFDNRVKQIEIIGSSPISDSGI